MVLCGMTMGTSRKGRQPRTAECTPSVPITHDTRAEEAGKGANRTKERKKKGEKDFERRENGKKTWRRAEVHAKAVSLGSHVGDCFSPFDLDQLSRKRGGKRIHQGGKQKGLLGQKRLLLLTYFNFLTLSHSSLLAIDPHMPLISSACCCVSFLAVVLLSFPAVVCTSPSGTPLVEPF